LAGKSGYLPVQLFPSRGERMVSLPELTPGDVAVKIEAVELLRFGNELLVLMPKGLKEARSLADLRVDPGELYRERFRREHHPLEFLYKYCFKIVGCNPCQALLAGVLRTVRDH